MFLKLHTPDPAVKTRLISWNNVGNYIRQKNFSNSRPSPNANVKFQDLTPYTPLLDEAAFRIFKQYADKDFSFTDCTSFAAMQFLKLRKAFAFDKHFEQYDNLERLP